MYFHTWWAFLINQQDNVKFDYEGNNVAKVQRSCTVKDLKRDEIPKSFLRVSTQQRIYRTSVKLLLEKVFLFLLFFKHKENEKVSKANMELLGNLDEIDENKSTKQKCIYSDSEVVVKRIMIICPERPEGDIELNFAVYLNNIVDWRRAKTEKIVCSHAKQPNSC